VCGGCTLFDLDASFRFIGGWIYAYHQNRLGLLRLFGMFNIPLLNYFMKSEEYNLSYLWIIHLAQKRIKLLKNEIKNNRFAQLRLEMVCAIKPVTRLALADYFIRFLQCACPHPCSLANY
jgi:hypothetical protein